MFTFAVALLVILCRNVLATPRILLSISVSKPGIDDLVVTTRIINTGKNTLKLLNHPQTVLSHLPTRIFHIARGNNTPEFTGMIVHYSPDYVVHKNNSVDFTLIAPGHASEHVHALAGVYNFTVSEPGVYQIEAYSRLYHVDGSGNVASVEAETQPIQFQLSGGLSRAHNMALKHVSLFAGGTQMLQSGCTIDQQNTIIEAATYADQYISNALTYLQNLNGYTPRYGAWFGLYDSQRVETVKSHYANSVGRAMLSSYDCMPDSCQDGAVAYVWRQQPGVIHFCSWFWSRPAYGSNSKAGTIVHELSHFTGTDDHVYSEAGSLGLAQTSPDLAVMNADSHMYFAENYPPLQ